MASNGMKSRVPDRNALPIGRVKELASGTHPVRVWRKHRNMTLTDLSRASGIGQKRLAEIETRKRPGNGDTMAKIARALEIPLDNLTVWLKARAPVRKRS